MKKKTNFLMKKCRLKKKHLRKCMLNFYKENLSLGISYSCKYFLAEKVPKIIYRIL